MKFDKAILIKCLKLLQAIFGEGPESLSWLMTKHIILGNNTPLDCLSNERSQEVIDILETIISKSV